VLTRYSLRKSVSVVSMLLLASAAAHSAGMIWAKGQIHDHSTNSDGTGSPQQVADWYRTNGYQFLILTDHEKVTDPTSLDKGPGGQFIMIPGEELACTSKGLPIHANAFGISATLKSPAGLETPAKTVANLVDYIRKNGGIPHVNHPSWYWALSHRDMETIEGPFLLEIANMSFGCNNEGNQAHLSTEQMWDYLLSNGKTVYATATDDMHKLEAKPNEDAGPGRGWVVARIPELTPQAVLSALSKGEFYASNGVELADVSISKKEFAVSVVPKAGQTYVIRFIGKWGSILQETDGTSAKYRVYRSSDVNSYVRCKVISSDGTVAWTQAYRVR